MNKRLLYIFFIFLLNSNIGFSSDSNDVFKDFKSFRDAVEEALKVKKKLTEKYTFTISANLFEKLDTTRSGKKPDPARYRVSGNGSTISFIANKTPEKATLSFTFKPLNRFKQYLERVEKQKQISSGPNSEDESDDTEDEERTFTEEQVLPPAEEEVLPPAEEQVLPPAEEEVLPPAEEQVLSPAEENSPSLIGNKRLSPSALLSTL